MPRRSANRNIANGASAGLQTKPAADDRQRLIEHERDDDAVASAAAIDGMTKDDTGRPVASAIVRFNRNGATFLARTDAHGRYALRTVTQGRYLVSASKPGFVTSLFGQSDATEPPTILTVHAHESIHDVNVLMIRGGTIAGRVVDNEGSGVLDVKVRVVSQAKSADVGCGQPLSTDVQRSQRIIRMTTTDDLGRFRISDVPVSNYYVLADPEVVPVVDTDATWFVPTYYPHSVSLTHAQPVVVTASANKDIVLSLARESLAVVEGIVEKASGERAVQGSVRLQIADQGKCLTSPQVIRLTAGGTFQGRVSVGREYTLIASVGNPWSAPGIQQEIQAARLQFSVHGTHTKLIVRTNIGLTVTGTVSVVGSVGSEDMSRLRLFPVPFAENDYNVIASTAVNEDGTFALKNVFGHSAIGIDGPPGWSPRAVLAGDGTDLTDSGVMGEYEALLRHVRIVIDHDDSEISGTVFYQEGVYCASCFVTYFAVNANKRTEPLRKNVGFVRADGTGHFVLRPLPPGEYYVAAMKSLSEAAFGAPALFRELERDARRVSINAHQSLALNVVVARQRVTAP